MSDYLPVRDDGDELPMVVASGQSVAGGQLVKVNSSGTVLPTSDATAFLGVALFDGAAGALVTVMCEGVHESTASGSVTAGNLIEPAASGQVAAHTLGTNDANCIGIALTSATNGNKVRWRRS